LFLLLFVFLSEDSAPVSETTSTRRDIAVTRLVARNWSPLQPLRSSVARHWMGLIPGSKMMLVLAQASDDDPAPHRKSHTTT